MKARLTLCLLLSGAGLVLPAHAQEATTGLTRAVELMKNNQHAAAIPLLLEEVKGKPEAGAVRQFLLLGECYYLNKQYEQAKGWLSKAARYGQGDERTAAAYRLAGVAFRLGEYNDATGQIDAFLQAYPNDARGGKLLVYKMAILGRLGRSVQKELEGLYGRVQGNVRSYGYVTAQEAEGVLSDFYQKTGQPDRALEIYAKIVHGHRKLLADLEKEKAALPAGLEAYHDNAALQAGQICLERKQPGEAIKWLENVRYDAELKMKARLFIAKVHYDKQDFGQAIQSLTEGNYVETVPAGPVKYDMYLLLGMSEKNRPDGNGARASEYLRKVAPAAKGYCQAQCALGNLYRERGLKDEAARAYQAALASPDYAPQALLGLGAIFQDQGDEAREVEKAKALHRKAADAFSQLLARYPLSPQAKECRPKVDALRAKGVDVTFAGSDEDMVTAWKKTAAEKKGSPEGAQALMSLIRFHARQVVDEKTKKVLKAPGYAACAAACDQVLDEKVYGGAALASESWPALRAEAFYSRGVCELASAFPPKAGSEAAGATYLEKADVDRAIGFFTEAKKLADPKKLDFVKQVELGLLEALFKSSRKENKDLAEKRFAELENDYGHDPRFQKLTLELAEFFQAQGRWADAAKTYEGVADRGKDLPEEDQLKALYLGGALYSKAALEVEEKAGAQGFGLYLYPKQAIQVTEDVLKTYAPLQKVVQLPTGSGRGSGVSGKEALVVLSKASGVPFVWAPGGKGSVADYLETKKVQLGGEKQTVAYFLGQILDPRVHRVDYDLGATGGQPTLTAQPDESAPDEERSQVLEIYDQANADGRYPPLARSYGAWRSVHPDSRPAMLLTILRRIEEVTGTKVLWAEGVAKDEKLAAEFRDLPGLPGLLQKGEYSCAKVLAAALDGLGLRYKVIRRDLSADGYEKAKDCFNKLRKIDPKSKYGERALYVLATNYYHQRDYPKMRVILREYLKVFDNPTYEYYHETCFWLGWLLEQEKKYRDACSYYTKAAEECLVLYKPAAPETAPDKEALRKRLSNDTQFALAVPVTGEFKEATLAQFLDFVYLNTHVVVRVEPGVEQGRAPLNRAAFRNLPALDLVQETLAALGLSVRGENVDRSAAERAYFRLASVFRKDDQMDLALENCDLLLARYPETKRKKEIYALKLEIYKGLKDYGKVLTTLEALKALGGSEIEGYRYDLELAGIYYDLCHYTRAVELYKSAMTGTKDPEELTAMREGCARALFRNGNDAEALTLYAQLLKDEPQPLSRFVDSLMVFYLGLLQGKMTEAEAPDEALRFIAAYEQLPDAHREALKSAELAKATWVYYVLGLVDLKRGRFEDGVKKLTAACSSPDDLLAGEAGFQVGMAYWKGRGEPGYLNKAREGFEYVLFSTKSTEAAVRATYMLGLCLKESGQAAKAQERFDQLVQRYPASPFAELARKEGGKSR